MDEILTVGEMESRFVAEWLLVEEPQTDEALEVRSGKVLFHSKDRDEVYRKAVAWAIELDEFFDKKDIHTAQRMLDQGGQRLVELQSGSSPWTRSTGRIIRGYVSKLDDSVQPYGLVIPEGHDFNQPCPLYVWLHGRGDRTTELTFIQQRQQSDGRFTPEGAIVLHPFGRYCNGYKWSYEGNNP